MKWKEDQKMVLSSDTVLILKTTVKWLSTEYLLRGFPQNSGENTDELKLALSTYYWSEWMNTSVFSTVIYAWDFHQKKKKCNKIYGFGI